MSRQMMAVTAVVVIGAFIVGSYTTTAESFPEATTEQAVFSPTEFISFGGLGPMTLTNPGAAQGETFMITHIFTNTSSSLSGRADIHMPPEFGSTYILAVLNGAAGSLPMHSVTLPRPIPWTTTLDVNVTGGGVAWLVFAGYYTSNPPVITVLDP